MFSILCDKCGEKLLIDDKATLDEYMKDCDYIVEEEGKIVEKSLQQYLIYKCNLCGEIYKFTYKEWEAKYRQKIAMDVMEVRKQKMFAENINPQTINPDNGLEYCGQCSGYAGDGHCLVDIIKQCTIRKDK
jgi:RNase P subunit RPR2